MTVVAVALSGRALAAAARRAGTICDVIDLFGDSDTRSLARRWIAGEGSLAAGFAAAPLLAALAALRPSAIVYGAGFESNPALLADMAALAPLLGNAPEAIAAVKDPLGFAATLKRLGLPHPETRQSGVDGPGWLEKRVGGSGGTHIRPATGAMDGATEADRYVQRRVPGRPVSALFVADGRSVRMIGLSQQWSIPGRGMPYRFGGCAAPAAIPAHLAAIVAEACASLARAFTLRGLNSLDLLVEGDKFTVLEVNPRPGATLDVFDGGGEASLWRMHEAGVGGTLPSAPAPAGTGRAAMVVYAPERLAVPGSIAWPDWLADRPLLGASIDAGDPVCTVLADAPNAALARAEAERRAAAILAQLVPAPIASPALG